jgi:hypothetical protein
VSRVGYSQPQGDNVEEARRNLLEALELFFKTASPQGGSGTASHPGIFDPAGNIGWVDCVFYLAEKPVVFRNSTVSGKLGGGAIILIMQYQELNSTRTVLVPDHRELRVGTLLSVIRQSGVAREIFEE